MQRGSPQLNNASKDSPFDVVDMGRIFVTVPVLNRVIKLRQAVFLACYHKRTASVLLLPQPLSD